MSEDDEVSLARRVDDVFNVSADLREELTALDAPVIRRAFRQRLGELIDGRAELP